MRGPVRDPREETVVSESRLGGAWAVVSGSQLMQHLLPTSPSPLSIVGIDGRSRSGKTTLADVMAACSEHVAVVHTDDIAWHHSFFDWSDELVDGVLRPLRTAGAPVSFVPQPWVERGRAGSIDIPADTRVVLVEGVGATRLELSRWLDASVWVHTDPDVAMRRTIALDRDAPGFVEDWMRAENEHLSADQPWTRAFTVVSGEHPVTKEAVHVRLRPASQAAATGGSRVFNVAAVLFDNDGVLVDSHDVAAGVWNLWAQRWVPGFDFHRDITHGLPLRDVVASLVTPDDIADATQSLIEMEITLATGVPAVRGAAELVGRCPAGTWAVVTSGRRPVALARLDAAKIPRPDVIISADDVERGKPAPDPYLAGARRLGRAPRNCAVFEDAPAGIISARRAGVARVIGVGEATLGEDIDVAVSSLSGITFDGARLTIPREVIVNAR
jgi:mannitol-1-/sugar-/sorbitol-6-phosphatase